VQGLGGEGLGDRRRLRFVTRSLYSDMDAFRNINNVAFSRWFEEGRADLNIRVFGVHAMTDPPDGLQLLLARTLVEYFAPLSYPGEVTVATAVWQVGTSSYGTRHALSATTSASRSVTRSWSRHAEADQKP
jgi:acyl-CoA thioesterase FadM